MEKETIIIKGAREHNLKNIDIEIPRDSFTVITGLSGSGKSSLAFDTIYAEGQRRYIESLSAYARQFLDMLEKPDVDLIEGLSPAISIEQKSASGNPRSTVGTVTEIYDYLRLLYARLGVPHCYNCGRPVTKQTTAQIIDTVISNLKGKKISVLAPVVRGRKGHYRELFEEILSDGFLRVRVDGEFHEITKGFQVDRYKIHNIEISIDRISVNESSRSRVSESIDVGLNYGKELDLNLIIPDWDKSINEEGLAPLGKPRQIWFFNQLNVIAEKYNFTFDTKLKDLTEEQKDILLYGSKEKIPFSYSYGGGKPVTYMHKFAGIYSYLKNYYNTTTSNNVREWVESFMNTIACPTCGGGRLKMNRCRLNFRGRTLVK
ncbi:MAG: hypothetical protein P8Z35_23195 [Ignavibacteriaceae bacterium]